MNPSYQATSRDGRISQLVDGLTGNPSVNGQAGWPARIDHIMSQTDFPADQLRYSNLVGSCDSWFGGYHICDEKEGSAKLEILDPVTGNGVHVISFDRSTGRIDSIEVSLKSDIETLNLNADSLCRARKAVFTELRDRLRKAAKPGVYNTALNTALRRFTEPVGGVLPPFPLVALDYLEKKLARRS